ncbi:MAG: glycosyltransferase family 2 protein [Chloroflexota bacterium]|nr:glycosyltransferase family 2 protein [Chloroflexota bacterium]
MAKSTEPSRLGKLKKSEASVVVCCYTMQRLEDTLEAVHSVREQTFKPVEVIIVVDHNEELYQRFLLEMNGDKSSLPPVRVLLNEGISGLSEARNVGVRAAVGEIIAFVDDDAIAEPDWLANLVNPFQSSNDSIVAVGGKAVPIWPSGERPGWFPEELDWLVGCTYRGLPLYGDQIRNVPGCNMAFRRDIFDVAGFWDTQIGATGQLRKDGEEAEFCLRIKQAIPDGRICYEPKAVIWHKVLPDRASLRWVWRRSLMQGQSKKIVKVHSESCDPLSTENSYLRYLLVTSIPERLRSFYKPQSVSQVGTITLTVVATTIGYVRGRG